MKKQSKSEKALDRPVYDHNGKKIGTVSLNNKVFDGEVNVPLLHQVITMYNANRRSGSASTKTKAQVRGGGKKPWRQKGTGRARTGSIRNPLWRSGGIIFGPKPRNFSYSVPRKIKKSAVRSSLNSKLLDDKLIIINEIKLDQPKTKKLLSVLESLGIKKKESAMVILDSLDRNVKLASRNIPNLCVKSTNNFNALDILKYRKLIVQKSVLNTLMKGLS